VDYLLRRHKEQLDSTNFLEIGPGKYAGAHWQDGFLFVWDDAFVVAEGIVRKHFPGFDHYAMNDLPEEVGEKVIAEWRAVAGQLEQMTPDRARQALNLPDDDPELDRELATRRRDIARMLRELADECEKFYQQSEWICVLGI
jgi:hypothetical protein